MAFLLGTQNIVTYLIDRGFGTLKDFEKATIESKICKNFNLLVALENDRHLLLKQEPLDREGKTRQDLLYEWTIQQFIEEFPELEFIRLLISEAIDFDRSHSILIFNYLNDYSDLSDFYDEKQIFPVEIARSIGSSLAKIHRATFNCQNYKHFLEDRCRKIDVIPNFLSGLSRIEPEIFTRISIDSLKFFQLYQRYEELGRSIAELNQSFQACCLTHNDLKLNNILVQNNWQENVNNSSCGDREVIRLIDWEKWAWGDPAFDLGTLIGSYLKIWLNSLVISIDIDLVTALSLAKIPLELLQPSIASLTIAYLNYFPEIIEQKSSFLKRVVQFAGLALIERIRAAIHYREPFDNTSICMLEVAKTLLCAPERSIETIFGISEAAIVAVSSQQKRG